MSVTTEKVLSGFCPACCHTPEAVFFICLPFVNNIYYCPLCLSTNQILKKQQTWTDNDVGELYLLYYSYWRGQ